MMLRKSRSSRPGFLSSLRDFTDDDRVPSDESLGYFLSPCGLADGWNTSPENSSTFLVTFAGERLRNGVNGQN
jgi:hypothetical protein